MRLLDLRSRKMRWCQTVSEGAEGARWCQRMPDDARWCQRVPDGVRRCQRVPEGPDRDVRGSVLDKVSS